MSDKYNAELVKNPKWFAKSHVMSCAAAIEYGLKVHDHYLSVPSDKRVCYWNVEEETEDPLDKICNVRISSKYLRVLIFQKKILTIKHDMIKVTVDEDINSPEGGIV